MKIENPYIENLKKEEFSFYGYPIKYELRDYENVLDKIKNKGYTFSLYFRRGKCSRNI